jgi:hypothetical protein
VKHAACRVKGENRAEGFEVAASLRPAEVCGKARGKERETIRRRAEVDGHLAVNDS